MSHAASLIARQGETATRHERLLGARDLETNWPEVTYTETGDFDPADFDCDDFTCFRELPGNTIRIFAVPLSERVEEFDAGLLRVTKYRIITSDEIAYLDRIRYQGETYIIDTEPQLHYLRGNLQYRNATMVRQT